MFYALGENNVRVLIDDADKKRNYHCPCCNYPVIVKQGKVNAWHYAHRPGSQCDAAYSEKTEWHREWQEKFPEECREVVVSDITGYKRIADIKIDGITIEFQSQSIPKDVFDARNIHHNKASSKVIWIFNCFDKAITTRVFAKGLDGNLNGNQWYSWAHPNRLLAKYKYRSWGMVDKDNGYVFKNIEVYLQTCKNHMVKIISVPDERDNVGWFYGKPVLTEAFVDGLVAAYNKPMQMSMVL